MGPSSPPSPAALTAAQLDNQLNSQLTDAFNVDVDSQMSIARGSNAPPPSSSIQPSFAYFRA